MNTATRITPSTTTKRPVESIGSQLVSSAGPTLNSISANPIASANEKMIWPRPIWVWISPSSSRSCEATLAEIASARKPIARDSPSAMTPRTTGRRQTFRRFIGDSISRTTSVMSPSGVRTATAQLDGLRIMTPSRTAWPPYVIFTARSAAARAAGLLEPALEALHPTARVDELLLPRVEGMAGGADLHVQLGLRGAGPELVAARARHVREDVVGVDVGLHGPARIPAAVPAATFPPETMHTVRPPPVFPARTAATAAAPAGSQASLARS